MVNSATPLKVWMVCGEESGDQLGAGLAAALRLRLGSGVAFGGVGGERLAREGLQSLFPLSDIAVMGFIAPVMRLPTLIRRVYQTVNAIVAARPDVLVIIDSPDFTHAVAKRVRKRLPELPIVDYVSPSVWAWRPGRARKMAAYVDHLLALLPFEPEAHRRLGGPACTYVGHRLIEKLPLLRGDRQLDHPLASPPRLLVLPGSRRSEISRLLNVFGETLGQLHDRGLHFDLTLPAVSHLENEIRAGVARWKTPPQIVVGEAAKFHAFQQADAALAASGTVTLELALAGVPMVVAYRVSDIESAILRRLITAQSAVLANLILGENAIPEFIQQDCTIDNLSAALTPLLSDTPVRRAQIAALAEVEARMTTGGETPSERAAGIVLDVAMRGRG
ncbi:lipid-A-disaccharide synthase [Camelimonas lactis]|uniref:lipid-A-disaccharide synthase n=1 Tax=Camelimonas lactis TaxID=659006 RepID=UPI00104D8192|nr:lipid-A-disaccharide synthase [Camelimonas lactis]